MKRKFVLFLLFATFAIPSFCQDNPFEVETVTIDKASAVVTKENSTERKLLEDKIAEKGAITGWKATLLKILKEIASIFGSSAKADEIDSKLQPKKTPVATEEKKTEIKAKAAPVIETPEVVTPKAPSGKGVSTGSADFKTWFKDAAKFTDDWEFPDVTNKYGKKITREDYLRAIIWIESRGIHKSPKGTVTKSWAGALGFMQLMPNTARGLKIDPKDPAQNLKGGAKYLKEIFNSGSVSKKSGAEKLIMGACAYNLGPFSRSMKSDWNTFKMNRKIPTETRGYGLKLKMCLGLELTSEEKELVEKWLVQDGQTVDKLTDENYSNTHGIAN